MRVSALSVVVCLCAVASAPAAPDAATRSLIDGSHWKQARAILEPRVKANQSGAEAAALLSRVRMAYGDLDAALPLAETAVRIEPKSADYHWQLAQVVGEMAQRASVFRQLGLARRYRQEAEAAIQLDPTVIDARIGMLGVLPPGARDRRRRREESRPAGRRDRPHRSRLRFPREGAGDRRRQGDGRSRVALSSGGDAARSGREVRRRRAGC